MAGAVNIKFGAIIGGFTSGVGQMGAAVAGFTRQLNTDLAAGYASAAREQRIYDRGLGQLGKNLQSFGRQASVLTAGIALLGATSFQSYAQLDALQLGLQNITGSAEGATARFNELREVAKLPGLGLEEAAKGDVRLQAVGFSAKTSKEALLQFGNALALTGGGKFELDSVLTQLTQMGSKAKVLAEDLKPILTSSPAVAKAIKDLFGTVDSEQISAKLQAAGKGPQDFIQDLILKLSELNRVAGGPKNALENLGDATKIAQFEFGKAADKSLGLTDKLNAVGDSLTKAAVGFGNLSPAAQGVTLGLVGLAASIGPVALGIGTLIQLGPTFIAGLTKIKLALAALTTPFGAIAVGITATIAAFAILGTSISAYSAGLETTANKAQLLADTNDKVSASIINETSKLGSLLAIARDETISKKARLQAVADLNALSPEYLGNLRLETINTAQATSAINQYTNALTLKAKVQILSQQSAEKALAADRAAAKSAKDFVDRSRFSKDVIATNVKTTFSLDPVNEREKLLTSLGQRRKDAAVKLAQDEAKVVNEELKKAYADAAKDNIQLEAPKIKPFDYKSIDLGGSAIKKLKDEYKKLKEEIQSTIVTKGESGVTAAQRERLALLKEQIKTAKQVTDPTKPKVGRSEKPLSDLENFVLAKKLIEEEIQAKLLKGLTVDPQTYFELEKVEQILRRIKGETAKDLRLKPAGTSALSLNLQSEGERQLKFIGGLKDRLIELRNFGSFAFLQDQVAKLNTEIQKLSLKGKLIPTSAIGDLAAYTRQIRDANNAVEDAQGFANVLVDNQSNGNLPVLADVERMIAQIEKGKGAINLSVASIAEAMRQGRETLKLAGADLLAGLGESIGKGQNPLKTALGAILGLLSNYIIQLGTALLLSSSALLAAAPLTFGITLAPGLGQQLAGAGLIVAGGLIKGIGATAFANGGIVSGPTLGLIGEYAGARNNPEVIAPLDKLRGMIGNTQPLVYIPEQRIEGSTIVLSYTRSIAENAAYS